MGYDSSYYLLIKYQLEKTRTKCSILRRAQVNFSWQQGFETSIKQKYPVAYSKSS